MSHPIPTVRCPLCGTPCDPDELAAVARLPGPALAHVAATLPGWRRRRGACADCLRCELLALLTDSADHVPPRLPPAAWNCLPTPLRLLADPRFTGAGITVALIDAGFHPHPDLIRPRNRIRAWVAVGMARVQVKTFRPTEEPRWSGWDRDSPQQWHGLMTSCVLAGSGGLSDGLYRGLAPEAELLLVKAGDEHGHVPNAAIARALRWLERHGPRWRLRIVNLSVGGDPVKDAAGAEIDAAIARLTAQGVVVVVAAGNRGARGLWPPSTAPAAIVVGGVDDRDSPLRRNWRPWHSDWGRATDGTAKPDLLAPSLRVAAPVLPDSTIADTADHLFNLRARGNRSAEPRIEQLKLVTPHYQHMDGTSVAAPLVSAIVAGMLQAHPELTPSRVRELLLRSCRRVPAMPRPRQGAGAVAAGLATTFALAERLGVPQHRVGPPRPRARSVRFRILAPAARSVEVVAEWAAGPVAAREMAAGQWRVDLPRPRPGRYRYHFRLDGQRLADPANTAVAADGQGGWDSVLTVPRPERFSPPEK